MNALDQPPDAEEIGHDHHDHRHWRDRIGLRRQFASGGGLCGLLGANHDLPRTLAAAIGGAAVVAADNRGALQGTDAVILALRLKVLKDVMNEIAER